jgi:hypothetical protein
MSVTVLRILVCDMPERKGIVRHSWSQVATVEAIKNPGKNRGHFSKSFEVGVAWPSKTEIR